MVQFGRPEVRSCEAGMPVRRGRVGGLMHLRLPAAGALARRTAGN